MVKDRPAQPVSDMKKIAIDNATSAQLDWLTSKAVGCDLVRRRTAAYAYALSKGKPAHVLNEKLQLADDWVVKTGGGLKEIRQWHRDAGSLRLAWELHIDLNWIWVPEAEDFSPVATGHELKYDSKGEYIDGSDLSSTGKTPIIAALRCYLKHIFGTHTTIPYDV